MPTEPGTPQRALLLAKPAKGEYRRNLPHLQVEDKPLFVTFVTLNRWVLPESVRDLVLKHCLYDHWVKYHLHGAIVMPDHVHMIFSALTDDEGKSFGLAEIMNGIKGASAHTINKTLGRVYYDIAQVQSRPTGHSPKRSPNKEGGGRPVNAMPTFHYWI